MSTVITSVDHRSPAQRAGVRPGEKLLTINGHEIVDVLDYRFYGYDAKCRLELLEPNGSVRNVQIKKEEGLDLGLNFDTYLMDEMRCCANHCVFCFVDQMPPGMRQTLYFKDDDARLSFLQGNYITLTNLTEREAQRIIDLRISPINVSVHTTDPQLHCTMLGNKNAVRSLEYMRRFCEAGIVMNGQIVICPGWNDGDQLRRTLRDLTEMEFSSCSLVPVGITKQGQWIVDGEDPRGWDMADGLPVVEKTPGSRDVVLDVALGQDGFFARNDDGTLSSLGHVDAVLPVLHGPYGEDGTIQGLLEMMDVPYVGCGVLASAACMDKHYTKVLLAAAGIPVAPGITVDARGFDAASRFAADADGLLARVEEAGLAYPLFVKPSRAGSSFGVTKVEHAGDAAELAAAVFEASHHDWRILIEQGIDAREIECAVLCPKAGSEPQASWPGEIVLDKRNSGDDQFYDFDSKYMDSSASHVEVPANLPQETLQQVRETAVKAFKAVDGAGLSRVDTFVTPDGEVMVNEINTMPGFTPISMYPKAWEATGIGYTELITKLIDGVLR